MPIIKNFIQTMKSNSDVTYQQTPVFQKGSFANITGLT
jgi:hypothetical protein